LIPLDATLSGGLMSLVFVISTVSVLAVSLMSTALAAKRAMRALSPVATQRPPT
jgi:hypothetical protein